MGATKTCIVFITIQLIYAVAAQEMSKRIPQGFLGMRGKKYIESNENEFYKRKPQFFVGVKGKKDFEAPYNTEFEYKRAPMGFIGMRGKKETLYPDLMYPESYEYVPRKSGSFVGQIDYATDDSNYNGIDHPLLDEVINEFLQKLRANEENEIETSTMAEDSNEMTNEVDKRTRMHQFFGVRGKKSIPEKRPYDLTFRGKFIGVRGKKDLKNSGAHEVKFLLNGPWPKRRGQMGFVGMRGKKWSDDATSDKVMPN